MRTIFLILVLASCASSIISNEKDIYQNSNLRLIKVLKQDSYYFHHVKNIQDTTLLISSNKYSENRIKSFDISQLKQIDFLPLKTDTLYFEYMIDVAGKERRIKATTAPLGKTSKTYYSYSDLPSWL